MIKQNDLKLLKTDTMSDTDDGGGLPTSQEIINGQSNNLFPDVSDIDKLTGRVRLRKIVGAVNTANTDLLQSARFFISELPNNDNMSVFLFKTTSFADRRTNAQNFLENYLAYGAKFAGHLLEAQLKGQSVIQQSLDVNDTLPKIGSSMVLVQNEGQSDEFFQYVRVMKVTAETRRFSVSSDKNVTRQVATIEISEPLRYQFDGISPAEYEKQQFNAKRIAYLREARVADASRYYSASRLAKPVSKMTTQMIELNSVFTQIVPSSQTETPLAQVGVALQQKTFVKASDNKTTKTITALVAPSVSVFLGCGIFPSSLSVTLNGQVLTDNNGELVNSSNVAFAKVDYTKGEIVWYDNVGNGNQSLTFEFVPSGFLGQIGNTDVIDVPEFDVGRAYVKTLQTRPTPLSLAVSYQVAGQVYVMTDNGRGVLTDSNGGVGSIDYETGLLTLTTGAIPDANSKMIASYGVNVNTYHYNEQYAKPLAINIAIPDKSLDYQSLTLKWGDTTITSDEKGNLLGGATGKAENGKISLYPAILPSKNTMIDIAYNVGEVKTEKLAKTATQSKIEFILAGVGEITKNSVRLTVDLKLDSHFTYQIQAYFTLDSISLVLVDDGQGKLLVHDFGSDYGKDLGAWLKPLIGKQAGVIDYAKRQISLDPSGLTFEVPDIDKWRNPMVFASA